MMKIASVASLLQGLGFGLPCLWGIWSLSMGKGIVRVMGYPAYGHGPFERMGIPTTIPLMVVFLIVCIMECMIGTGLWNSDKGMALLSLAIIPAELAFYYGFALPFGPPVLVLRMLIVLWCWSSLHA